MNAGLVCKTEGGIPAFVMREAVDDPCLKKYPAGKYYWVRLDAIQYRGLFFLYDARGVYVDHPYGPPSLKLIEEEELSFEEELAV